MVRPPFFVRFGSADCLPRKTHATHTTWRCTGTTPARAPLTARLTAGHRQWCCPELPASPPAPAPRTGG